MFLPVAVLFHTEEGVYSSSTSYLAQMSSIISIQRLPQPLSAHCRQRCPRGLEKLEPSAPGRNRTAGKCEEHS